jgi:hypothetical protein
MAEILATKQAVKLIKEYQINPADLEGTGKDGRILTTDVLTYLEEADEEGTQNANMPEPDPDIPPEFDAERLPEKTWEETETQVEPPADTVSTEKPKADSYPVFFEWETVEPDAGQYKPLKPFLRPVNIIVRVDLPGEYVIEETTVSPDQSVMVVTPEGMAYCATMLAQATLGEQAQPVEDDEEWTEEEWDDDSETTEDEWDEGDDDDEWDEADEEDDFEDDTADDLDEWAEEEGLDDEDDWD